MDASSRADPHHLFGLADEDIVYAYVYMLSRWLVLRQQARDFAEGFEWNRLVHREPGAVAWANPNLDVVYSEAWIALDGSSCTLLELPEIRRRYYTVQAVNGWGEVTANVNERTFPHHPSGLFAFCLKGAEIALPAGAQRVDLPSRKSRILVRLELGADPAEAIALQQRITMRSSGAPRIDPDAEAPEFADGHLPGVAAFDRTDEILAGDADINPGMAELRDRSRQVGAAARDPRERSRIDEVIRDQAIPRFMAEIPRMGAIGNGWVHPRVTGNYGADAVMRSIANFTGIWANTSREVVYFTHPELDGGRTFTQTWRAHALPNSKVRYFWSVIAVDSIGFRVIPNPLDRYRLNNHSPLRDNPDGSLTLAFGPEPPKDVPEPNWLPTPRGRTYALIYRFYGPSDDVARGSYFPPPLEEQ
jgi:hypothetical protein